MTALKSLPGSSPDYQINRDGFQANLAAIVSTVLSPSEASAT